MDIKNLSQKYGLKIVRIYGVPEHGKIEIDCVGGVVKIALRRGVSMGHFFPSASSCIDYLKEPFDNNFDPRYVIKEIYPEALERMRRCARYTKFGKVPGSSKFRVMVFSPDSDVVKTAPHLCVCDICLEDYGNCSLFASHHIQDFTLNEVQLRSAFNPQDSCDNDGDSSEDGDDTNNIMDVAFLFCKNS